MIDLPMNALSNSFFRMFVGSMEDVLVGTARDGNCKDWLPQESAAELLRNFLTDPWPLS
ncbi:hypothetical protein [Ruegeria lacuscaerulensis]|uniref:hypothetical protein n=1 Tax=Ruegeria lacuscaerulensis TaxID=55218 RepID=UPI00147A0D6B|nr:hypothetical protein [Ruegeria lacuscaerulensis]